MYVDGAAKLDCTKRLVLFPGQILFHSYLGAEEDTAGRKKDRKEDREEGMEEKGRTTRRNPIILVDPARLKP